VARHALEEASFDGGGESAVSTLSLVVENFLDPHGNFLADEV
jgi:hypothetical protein